METWQSGLMRGLAKAESGQLDRGFESYSFRFERNMHA